MDVLTLWAPMRIVATLLVALTLLAGAPRAARAAGMAAHCCCPKGAHADGAAAAVADGAPRMTRTCPCEARPAPPAKLPGAAPAAEVSPRRDDAAPIAFVCVAPGAPIPAGPRAACVVARLAARAPPLARTLFSQHVSLVV